MRRFSDERGSVTIFVIVFSAGLLAVLGVLVNAGSWYRAQRHLQAAADAAALAGAQDLPNTTNATTSATSYKTTNATSAQFVGGAPTYPCTVDGQVSCIDVQLTNSTPVRFASIFGLGSSLTVHGHARAGVGVPGSMKNLAAIVVNQTKACKTGHDCFGPSHTIDLNFDGAPGAGAAAGLVDLAGHNANQNLCTANASTSDIKGWIENGYSGLLPVNQWYGSPPGAKNGVQSSLEAMKGQVLLFPVFDTGSPTACGGAGGFHIIGWSAFVITQVVIWNNSGGGSHTLRGYFVEYIAHDVDSVPGVPGFGVKVITLTI